MSAVSSGSIGSYVCGDPGGVVSKATVAAKRGFRGPEEDLVEIEVHNVIHDKIVTKTSLHHIWLYYSLYARLR